MAKKKTRNVRSATQVIEDLENKIEVLKAKQAEKFILLEIQSCLAEGLLKPDEAKGARKTMRQFKAITKATKIFRELELHETAESSRRAAQDLMAHLSTFKRAHRVAAKSQKIKSAKRPESVAEVRENLFDLWEYYRDNPCKTRLLKIRKYIFGMSSSGPFEKLRTEVVRQYNVQGKKYGLPRLVCKK